MTFYCIMDNSKIGNMTYADFDHLAPALSILVWHHSPSKISEISVYSNTTLNAPNLIMRFQRFPTVN